MSEFSQLNFKHGSAKLNSNDASNIALVSNDGGNILVKSSDTGDYIPVALHPSGIVQNVFNGTAYVEGTANQSLSSNTLYSVYLRNLDGTETGCVLDFWRTFSGYNPTLDTNGIYIHPSEPITYLGQVWTGSNDISTIIAPSLNMRQPLYSHFNPWSFGFQTTQPYTTFYPSMNGAQASPSILTVTEGIENCFSVHGQLLFYGTIVGQLVTFSIKVSGTAINGSGGSMAWSSTSPSVQKTITSTSGWESLTAHWQSAPPIGVYTVQPVVTLSAGSMTSAMSLLANIYL